MHQSLDDILFEERNKEYGVYRLRKRYFIRLALSFLISVAAVTFLVLGYFWYLNSGGDETVYMFPSLYPSLKSTQGSLLDKDDLASYLKSTETPRNTDVDQKTPASDLHHNFKIADEATPDTIRQPEEEKTPSPGSSGLGMSSDSAVFGGYLLGEGDGGGMGNSLDKFPEFPGGPEGVRRYIELTVNYPLQAIKQKINGVVILSFDVNKLGEIDNIRVERGVNPMLDQEAIKAVKNMPRWKPGIRHGKPVIVKFVIPVRFMPIS
jgi:periplasmic protein TonB